MSPKAQQIAIAESRGWTSEKVVDHHTEAVHTWWKDPVGAYHRLPDYLNDSNAIIAAIRCLNNDQAEEFGHLIMDVIGWVTGSGFYDFWRIVSTTPDKLCEAYLKTLNLWDDTK